MAKTKRKIKIIINEMTKINECFIFLLLAKSTFDWMRFNDMMMFWKKPKRWFKKKLKEMKSNKKLKEILQMKIVIV